MYHNVLWEDVILASANLIYNELGLSSHWLSRNIINALAFATFNAGAIKVACNGV
jgi:hypothetical protein